MTYSSVAATKKLIPTKINWDGTIIIPKRPEKPITPNVLKMFEPNMFPTAISTFFFLAATTDTANSGRVVPKERIVAAIVSFPILKKVEINVIDWTT